MWLAAHSVVLPGLRLPGASPLCSRLWGGLLSGNNPPCSSCCLPRGQPLSSPSSDFPGSVTALPAPEAPSASVLLFPSFSKRTRGHPTASTRCLPDLRQCSPRPPQAPPGGHLHLPAEQSLLSLLLSVWPHVPAGRRVSWFCHHRAFWPILSLPPFTVSLSVDWQDSFGAGYHDRPRACGSDPALVGTAPGVHTATWETVVLAALSVSFLDRTHGEGPNLDELPMTAQYLSFYVTLDKNGPPVCPN